MKIYRIIYLLIPAILLHFTSCRKLTEVDIPQHQLITGTVYADSLTATAALLNIYARYSNTIDASFNLNVGVYGDDLQYTNSAIQVAEFANGLVSVTNSANDNAWRNLYFIIYSCNDLIQQAPKSAKLSPGLVRQLTGEAKFLRAFAYFNLTNAYGPVPLVLETDQNVTARVKNATGAELYAQINSDLADAVTSLPEAYPAGDRIRASKYAALALQARSYLFQKDWIKAETVAGQVIASGNYQLVTPDAVFPANSLETILEFQTQNGFTNSGQLFIPRTGKPAYAASANLLAQFAANDLRLARWTRNVTTGGKTYKLVYKYHNRAAGSAVPENLIALRFAEQYLIRSEARAHLGKISEGRNDLNIVRNRAGLPGTVAADGDALATAVQQERQRELFSEWGSRLYDLKRTGNADAILGSAKSNWKTGTSILLPIPQKEVTLDQNLQQNPGY